MNGTEPFYCFDGGPYTYAEATADLKAIWQQLHEDVSAASYPTLYTRPRSAARTRHDVDRRLDQGVRARRARLEARASCSTSPTTSSTAPSRNVQSSLNMLYLLGYSGQGQLRIFGPSNEKYHVRGGNDQIAGGLAAALAAVRSGPAPR